MKISLPLHLRRHANLQLLVIECGGVTTLATLAKSPRPHISALVSGDKACGNALAAKIERGTGKPPGWLDEARNVIHHRMTTSPPQVGGLAHEVIHTAVTTPPLTAWEDVVSLERLPAIPADLMVEVPDDALAERGLRKGQLVWFKAASTAEPRNVILIEAGGRRYIRRYSEDGRAQSLDDAYKTFTDFRIVAVMFMRPESSI